MIDSSGLVDPLNYNLGKVGISSKADYQGGVSNVSRDGDERAECSLDEV